MFDNAPTFINRTNSRKVYTIDELASRYPVLSSVAPHESRSERYKLVPTLSIIDEMMQHGWNPVQVSAAGVRAEHRRGFQKHMVRLTNPNLHMGEEQMDVILLNSHDGTTSYKVMAGVFRFVCSNGLVVGDQLSSINIRHNGFEAQDIIDASFTVVDMAGEVAGSMQEMKAIEMSPEEQHLFASTAATVLYEDNVRPASGQLLTANRYADNGNSLWKTYNNVQENWSKGRTSYRNADGKWRKNRAPASVDKDTKLNAALWNMAQEMMKLKKGM